MRYQRVVWHHDPNDYPTILFSEISDEGWELRKVDQYAGGRSLPMDAMVAVTRQTLNEGTAEGKGLDNGRN